MKTSAPQSHEDQARAASAVKSAIEVLDLPARLDEIRAFHRETWETSAPHENKKRDDAYQAISVVNMLEQQITATLSNGKLAEIELKRKNR